MVWRPKIGVVRRPLREFLWRDETIRFTLTCLHTPKAVFMSLRINFNETKSRIIIKKIVQLPVVQLLCEDTPPVDGGMGHGGMRSANDRLPPAPYR